MRITTKGFKEAVEKLRGIGKIAESQKFQRVLLRSVEPIRLGAIAKVHSVTGRTTRAITSASGKGKYPSAHVKIDKRLAAAVWRGRIFPYPVAVERGHGGPRPAPPHPFFVPAVKENRAAVRRIVRDGIKDVLDPYIGSSQAGGEFS